MERNASKKADTEVEPRKRLITIHSQKGGVGKTLIGLYLARRLAQKLDRWKGERTVFIDADLTGTSIADALPFEAPEQHGGFKKDYETRESLRKASGNTEPSLFPPRPRSGEPKFLNDLLLAAPEVYRSTLEKRGRSADFHRGLLLWRVSPGTLTEHLGGIAKGGDKRLELYQLRVIPSSGMPLHISQCVPHIYKEGVIAFLETRLAEIVHSLWTKPWEDDLPPFDSVVIDTSPMLRGISRVALNLHQRFKSPDNDFHPRVSVDSKALFVCSPDKQDIVDMGRALDHLMASRTTPPSSETGDNKEVHVIDHESVMLILNRVPKSVSVKMSWTEGGAERSGTFAFKDPPRVKEYFRACLTSLHVPQSQLLTTIIRDEAASENQSETGAPKPVLDQSHVLHKDPALEETFFGNFHNKKLLYGDPEKTSKEEYGFEELFKGVCKTP